MPVQIMPRGSAVSRAQASRLLFWMEGGFHALEFGNNVLGPIDRELIADRPLNLAVPSDQDVDFSALFAHARFRPEGARRPCSQVVPARTASARGH
jgi:hypothetical protein